MAISLFQEQRQRVNGDWHTVRVYTGDVGAGSTLTIHTPEVATNKVFLVGWAQSEANATNVTFNSSSTAILTLELAANQGVYDKVGQGALLCSKTGQALTVTSSAALSSVQFSVIESEAI